MNQPTIAGVLPWVSECTAVTLLVGWRFCQMVLVVGKLVVQCMLYLFLIAWLGAVQ